MGRRMDKVRKVAFFSLLMWIGIVPRAQAEPIEVTSPALKKVPLRGERALGRLIVYADFRTHRIVVDGAEYPAYLSDIGIEVTSNEIHEVSVTSSGGLEKSYRVSIDPGQVMALYVDLGKGKQKADKKGREASKNDVKKDDAKVGYLSVTAESEAQIYIDGKLISSKTPLKKHEVDVGSHTVRVYFFDTRKFSKSREVYISKGVSMSINFTKDN